MIVTDNTAIALLRKQIENILPLTDAEFLTVLSYFQLQTAPRRTFLIRENDRVKCLYLIVSGPVKLAYNDDKGREHVVSFATEDWWESDYQAFYNQTKAIFTLQCVEDTSLFCLSFDHYHEIGRAFPKIERYFKEMAVYGYIFSQKRILSFITLNAKDRYHQFIDLYPTLLQRVPKSLLASYLGVSRETLSRLF